MDAIDHTCCVVCGKPDAGYDRWRDGKRVAGPWHRLCIPPKHQVGKLPRTDAFKVRIVNVKLKPRSVPPLKHWRECFPDPAPIDLAELGDFLTRRFLETR